MKYFKSCKCFMFLCLYSLAVENAALHDVLQDKTEDMKQMHLSNIGKLVTA